MNLRERNTSLWANLDAYRQYTPICDSPNDDAAAQKPPIS